MCRERLSRVAIKTALLDASKVNIPEKIASKFIENFVKDSLIKTLQVLTSKQLLSRSSVGNVFLETTLKNDNDACVINTHKLRSFTKIGNTAQTAN